MVAYVRVVAIVHVVGLTVLEAVRLIPSRGRADESRTAADIPRPTSTNIYSLH